MTQRFAIEQLERARALGEMAPERFQLASSEPLTTEEFGEMGRLMIGRARLAAEGRADDVDPGRRPRFLGVDPGENVGLALWDQSIRDFLWMTTLGFWRSVLATLEMVSPLHDVIVIEHAGINRHMHRLHELDTTRSAARKGQSVGSVIEKTDVFLELVRGLGYCVQVKRPRNTKLEAKAWRLYTGASNVWTEKGMASAHARDAAGLVGHSEGSLQMFRRKAELIG